MDVHATAAPAAPGMAGMATAPAAPGMAGMAGMAGMTVAPATPGMAGMTTAPAAPGMAGMTTAPATPGMAGMAGMATAPAAPADTPSLIAGSELRSVGAPQFRIEPYADAMRAFETEMRSALREYFDAQSTLAEHGGSLEILRKAEERYSALEKQQDILLRFLRRFGAMVVASAHSYKAAQLGDVNPRMLEDAAASEKLAEMLYKAGADLHASAMRQKRLPDVPEQPSEQLAPELPAAGPLLGEPAMAPVAAMPAAGYGGKDPLAAKRVPLDKIRTTLRRAHDERQHMRKKYMSTCAQWLKREELGSDVKIAKARVERAAKEVRAQRDRVLRHIGSGRAGAASHLPDATALRACRARLRKLYDAFTAEMYARVKARDMSRMYDQKLKASLAGDDAVLAEAAVAAKLLSILPDNSVLYKSFYHACEQHVQACEKRMAVLSNYMAVTEELNKHVRAMDAQRVRRARWDKASQTAVLEWLEFEQAAGVKEASVRRAMQRMCGEGER